MAREMGHARQSVQRVAGVLVKEGLLIYSENPANRRSPLLELTPQGAEVLATIYALNEELTQRMMSKLNPEQLVEIADALEEIGNILEADGQQAIEQVTTNKSRQIRKHK
jgi:DNA-binding MarR family transcriptional regulator